MRQPHGWTGARLALVAAFTALLVPLDVRGDWVFFPDGFTLRGKVLKEGTMYQDPGGRAMWMPKAGGFYLVDDFARHIIFSTRQVTEAHPDPAPPNYEIFDFQENKGRLRANPRDRAITVVEDQKISQDWNEQGMRVVSINGPLGKLNLNQFMTDVTPHYTICKCQDWFWTTAMLTNEIGPEKVLPALRYHQLRNREAKAREDALGPKRKPGDPPAPKPPKPAEPPAKVVRTSEDYFAIFRFCIQAGWFDEAEKELDVLIKDFPDVAKAAEESRKDVRRLRADARLDQVLLAVKSGQPDKVQKLLAGFPEAGAKQATLNKVRVHRERYKELDANLNAVRHLLETVSKQMTDPEVQKEFTAAIAEITRDLNFDTVDRLEPFRLLARQEERNLAAGKKPTHSPEQLIALAVSGWAMGSNGAESEVTPVRRYWKARELLLTYLRTTSKTERAKQLDAYLRSESLRHDVFTQLIQWLPPAMPPEGASSVLDLKTPEKEVPYRLQLPPEYHPHRAYPVLIVLPNISNKPWEEKETPKDAIRKWGTLAAEHGYILVVPQWGGLFDNPEYQYSTREHNAVLDVLRDLRRRFNVDADRVLLAGYGQAGDMTFDIGLSHPDLFAGAVVMAGRPHKHPFVYYKSNAQHLPFYVVYGERAPIKEGTNDFQTNRRLFEEWVPRGYPGIYVEYVGRANEFFAGELPTIFDWMDRKKRARGLPQIGWKDPQKEIIAEPFASVREGDNHFYWLSAELHPNNILADGQFHQNMFPARVSGIVGEANRIRVAGNGLRELTIWLSAAMVDFDQPLDIEATVSGRTQERKQAIRVSDPKISLPILLEDFYERGDKRNLFIAKVVFRW